MAYAKYLSPEFHILCNEIIRKFVEEEHNPDLALDRAIGAYRRQGKDEEWIARRILGKVERNGMTSVMARSVDGITPVTSTSSTAATVTPFTNPDLFNGSLRVVIMKDGEPWFVAKDVCDALDMDSNQTTNYTRNLSPDEKIKVMRSSIISGNVGRGAPYVSLISESGLYKLIMRSDKPAAKPFQDWVTRTVLPAIRKDGMYGVMGEEKGTVAVNLRKLSFCLRSQS